MSEDGNFLINFNDKTCYMKAVETTGKIDKKGILHLSKPLKDKNRKVIVLMPEEGDEMGRLWVEAISSNPAFDFLNDPAEDIYSPKDDKRLNGKK